MPNVFRLEGEYWTVEYQGAVFRLRDGKGLQYLAYLLHRPGEQIGAEELITRIARTSPPAAEPIDSVPIAPEVQAERARSAVSKRIQSAMKRIRSHHSDLGSHLARSIRTGRVCSYVPESMEPITWVK